MTTASNFGFDSNPAPKKRNPSKSRQGRAVQVNGATRNPHWEYRPRASYRWSPPSPPERKVVMDAQEIEACKRSAARAAEEARFMMTDPAHPQYALYFWRVQRKFECLVSKALNRRWSVGILPEDERFKVQPAPLTNF